MAEGTKLKGKHSTVRIWEKYKVKGDKVVRSLKQCPKCGSNLGESQNRRHCGNCHYTEFLKASA